MTADASGLRAFSHNSRGILFTLTSAALFGASVPFAKLLLGAGIESGLLAGLLYLGSGIGLAATTVVSRLLAVPRREAPLRRADAPRLVLAIVAGGILAPLLLTWGLERTDAASASLLLNVEGVATLAIAWLVFHENADWRVVLGACAILAGAVVVSWTGTVGTVGLGSFAIVAACIAWAIDNNLTRSFSGSDPIVIAAWKGLVAGALNTLLALLAGAHLPSISLFALAGAVGFFGYGASLTLFVLALRHLGVARTGAYYSVAPFLGVLVAVGLLGEPFEPRLIAAGLLMATGVLLHIIEAHAHWHGHELLEHEHRHVHDAHHRHAHPSEAILNGAHTHRHVHDVAAHRHVHYPDLHHRHRHDSDEQSGEK